MTGLPYPRPGAEPSNLLDHPRHHRNDGLRSSPSSTSALELREIELDLPYHPPESQGGDGAGNRLPSYAELSSREPGRFGRWRSWIEKRARERTDERDEERELARREGRPAGTGWGPLPAGGRLGPEGPRLAIPPPPTMRRQSSLISSEAETAAFAEHISSSRHARRPSRPSLEPGPGVQPLTPSTAIHPIGSRFLPQFTSRPLCAAPLPIAPSGRAKYTAGHHVERFLLVGTAEGLFVCDLIPALSQSVNLRTVSCEDTKIYQLWEGLGMHQLAIGMEEVPGTSQGAGLPGVVIGLTTQWNDQGIEMDGGVKKVKMWPLQALINLVKFRAFSETSECLDLRVKTNAPKRQSALATGANAFTGLKKAFLDKGKHRESRESAVTAPLIPPVARIGDLESLPGTQDRRARSGSNAAATSPGSRASTFNSGDRLLDPAASSAAPNRSPRAQAFVTPPGKAHLELPLQWATTSAPLDFPRIQAHGPILFMRLCRAPSSGRTHSMDPTLPAALRRSRSTPSRRPKGLLFLLLATKQALFVLESLPGPKRTWQVCAEMSCPFTPTAAGVVLCEFGQRPQRAASYAPNGRRTHQRQASVYPGSDECVAVVMKDHAALIRMSDLAVREVETPGSVTDQARGGSLGSRASRKSLKPDDGLEGGGGGGGSSSFGRSHRPGHSLGSTEMLIGRMRHNSNDSAFTVESRRPRPCQERRWKACDELLVPVRRQRGASIAAVYLVTRGHMTYVTPSPVGAHGSAAVASPPPPTDLAAPALVIQPLHTFTWLGVPNRVRARFVATPPAWRGRRGGGGGGGGGEHNDGDEGEDDGLFCCVTAFTDTGVETQEGFVSLRHLELLRQGPPRPARPPFFTPASAAAQRSRRTQRAAPPGVEEEGAGEDPAGEMTTDTSSYDYSAPIGWLCSGGPWFGSGSGWGATASAAAARSSGLGRACAGASLGDSSTDGDDEDDEDDDRDLWRDAEALSNRGDFFWKESIGEYKIFWVGSATQRDA